MNNKKQRNRRRPISREEVEAMLDFYCMGNEKPRSMHSETFPRAVCKQKNTITQTIIEF